MRAGAGNIACVPNYHLKSVGVKGRMPPADWWRVRPELTKYLFFGRSYKPQGFEVGDRVVYYAVGAQGRLCAVAEVTGEPTQKFATPAGWPEGARLRYRWALPVKLLYKCSATEGAPVLADFEEAPMERVSYRPLQPDPARLITKAIAAREAAEKREAGRGA